MYNKLVKYGDAISVGLGVLCILIFIIGIVTGFNSAGYDMGTDLTTMQDKSNINFFNSGLYMDVSGGWDSRRARLTFSYNFGKQVNGKSRKRSTGLEDEQNRIKKS